MSGKVLHRSKILESLEGFLQTNTQTKWGVADLPDDLTNGERPYGVLYYMTALPANEAWDYIGDTVWQFIRMRSVGRTPVQAVWLSDKVAFALLEREPSGQYTYSLGDLEVHVECRDRVEQGALIKEDEATYSVEDTYKILMEAI